MNNIEKLKKELSDHIELGQGLALAMHVDCKIFTEEKAKSIYGKDLPNFDSQYEPWYTKSIYLLRQVLPDRVDDFVAQYKLPKRKDITYDTYTIYDYLIGLKVSRGISVVADKKAATSKMNNQFSILISCLQRFDSLLFDIKIILQADLFDNELDAAVELNNKGFVRGAGAIAGVVLESHLSVVCDNHSIRIKKKDPSINDYNQALKDNDIIDIATWRFIQHLADVRNTCDHKKKSAPKKEDVEDLIKGVSKISKTVS